MPVPMTSPLNESLDPPVLPPQTPVEERIHARLQYLYGASEADAIAKRINRLIKTHRQLRTRMVQGEHWSHDDVVLITYGDSIQSSTHTPLQTLHQFLNTHLQWRHQHGAYPAVLSVEFGRRLLGDRLSGGQGGSGQLAGHQAPVAKTSTWRSTWS